MRTGFPSRIHRTPLREHHRFPWAFRMVGATEEPFAVRPKYLGGTRLGLHTDGMAGKRGIALVLSAFTKGSVK